MVAQTSPYVRRALPAVLLVVALAAAAQEEVTLQSLSEEDLITEQELSEVVDEATNTVLQAVEGTQRSLNTLAAENTRRGVAWEPLGALAVMMPLLIWIITRLTQNTERLAPISERLGDLVDAAKKMTVAQNEHGNRLAKIETTLKERDWRR